MIPDILAQRYASEAMQQLWSPENKVVLERRLWIAVLKAQRDLGIAIPDGVVEAYEAVAEKVDLGASTRAIASPSMTSRRASTSSAPWPVTSTSTRG